MRSGSPHIDQKLMQKHFRFYTILALLFVVLAPASNAQELSPADPLAQVLIGKEKEMFDAIVNGDKPAAEKLFGRDYVTINADGTMANWEETMKTFGGFKGATYALSDKKIRTYQDIAIITGGAKFYMKGILAAQIFYTETWVLRGADWQFIGWQGTMTGLPTWYPIIMTLLLLGILYLLVRLVLRITRSRRRRLGQL